MVVHSRSGIKNGCLVHVNVRYLCVHAWPVNQMGTVLVRVDPVVMLNFREFPVLRRVVMDRLHYKLDLVSPSDKMKQYLVPPFTFK